MCPMTAHSEAPPIPKISKAMLRDVRLFAGLPDERLEELARELSTRHFEAGQVKMLKDGAIRVPGK